MRKTVTILLSTLLKEKKTLVYACCILAFSCQSPYVYYSEDVNNLPQTKSEVKDTSIKHINEPIVFLADTSFSTWAHIKGMSNRMKACESSDSVLSLMTSEALLKSILHYPLNYSILSYDNPLSGVNFISKRSNLHQEFVRRKDAGDLLISYFLSSHIDLNKTCDVHDDDYSNLSAVNQLFLEYYLCSDDISQVLTKENRDSLSIHIKDCIKRRMNDEKLRSSLFLAPLLLIEETVVDDSTCNDNREQSRSQEITTVYTTFRKALRGELQDEMSPEAIYYFNNVFTQQHPYATLISSSSNKYNCHSYAWHNESTTNSVWLNSMNYSTNVFQLDKYWTNDLFVEVPSSVANGRVYYEASNPEYSHSAVVLPSGKLRSKWGAGPLMEHDLYDVPNTYLDSLETLRYFDYRDTPLLNVYTFYGDTAVLPNTSHLYYVDPYYGVANEWSVEYITNNTISPFTFVWQNGSSGGTYSLSCQEMGAYKIFVNGYYQGHHVAWGEKIVVCVGARGRYVLSVPSDEE